MTLILDMIKRQCLKHFSHDLISKFKQDCSVHKSTLGAELKPLGYKGFSNGYSESMLIEETRETEDDFIHSILNGIPKPQPRPSTSSKTLSVRHPSNSENSDDPDNVQTNNYPLITSFSSQHRILKNESSVHNTIHKVLIDICGGSPSDSKVNPTNLLKGENRKSSADKNFTEALQGSIKSDQLTTSQLDNIVPQTSTVPINQTYSNNDLITEQSIHDNSSERKFKSDECEQTTQISSPKDLNSCNGDANRSQNKNSNAYLRPFNECKEQSLDIRKGNYAPHFYNFFPEKPLVAQNMNLYSSQNKLMTIPDTKEDQLTTQSKTPSSKPNIQPSDLCGKNLSDIKNDEPSVTQINIDSSPRTSTPSSFQCVQTISTANALHSTSTNQTHSENILKVEPSVSQNNQQSSDKFCQPSTTQRDTEYEDNSFTISPVIRVSSTNQISTMRLIEQPTSPQSYYNRKPTSQLSNNQNKILKQPSKLQYDHLQEEMESSSSQDSPSFRIQNNDVRNQQYEKPDLKNDQLISLQNEESFYVKTDLACSSSYEQPQNASNMLPSSLSCENPNRSLNIMPTSSGYEEPCSASNGIPSSSICEIPISSLSIIPTNSSSEQQPDRASNSLPTSSSCLPTISSLNIMPTTSSYGQPCSALSGLSSNSSCEYPIKTINITPTNSSFEKPYSASNVLTASSNNVKSIKSLNILPISSINQPLIKEEDINDPKYSKNTSKQTDHASSPKTVQLSSSHYENPLTAQTFQASTPFRRVFQLRNEQTSTPQIESINTTLEQTSPLFQGQNEKQPIPQTKIQFTQEKIDEDKNLGKTEEATFDGNKTNKKDTKSAYNDNVVKHSQVIFPGIYNPVFSPSLNVTFCEKRSVGKIRKHNSILNKSMRSKIRFVIDNEARKLTAQNYATIGSANHSGQPDDQLSNTHLNHARSDQNKMFYSYRIPQKADNEQEQAQREIKNNEASEISDQQKDTKSRELSMDKSSTEKITEMLMKHTQLLEILIDRVNLMGKKKVLSEQEKSSSLQKEHTQRKWEAYLNSVELGQRLTSTSPFKYSVKTKQEKEPQLSSKEPQISSKVPQISSKEPQISSKEPQILSEKPQISTEKPQTSTEKPQLSSEEPQISEEPQTSSTMKEEEANTNKSETKQVPSKGENRNKNRDSFVPGNQLGVKSLNKLREAPFGLTSHQFIDDYKTSDPFGAKLAQYNYNPLKQLLSEYPVNILKSEMVNKPELSYKSLYESNKKKPKEQKRVNWRTSYASYLKNKQTQDKMIMKIQPDYSALKVKAINKTVKTDIKKKAKKINTPSEKKPTNKLSNTLKPQQDINKLSKIKVKTPKEKMWEEKLKNLKFSKGIFFKQKNQTDKNNSKTTSKKKSVEPFGEVMKKKNETINKSKINLQNSFNFSSQSDRVSVSSENENAIKQWNWRGTNQYLEGPSWNQTTEYFYVKDQWNSPSGNEKIARIHPRVVVVNKQTKSDDNARKTIEYLISLSDKIKSNKVSFNNVLTSSLALSKGKSRLNEMFNIQKRFKSEKIKGKPKLNLSVK